MEVPMTRSEYGHVRNLACQIVTELDKDELLELLVELNEFVERIELRTHPRSQAS